MNHSSELDGQKRWLRNHAAISFPWHHCGEVIRLVIAQEPTLPGRVAMVLQHIDESNVAIQVRMLGVVACKLPEIGTKRLAYSHAILADVRDWQLEGVTFRLYDENFAEPEFLCHSIRVRFIGRK
ncbi:MAG: hypothetical protein R3C17_11665 [Planctomycetaceae bacterium]